MGTRFGGESGQNPPLVHSFFGRFFVEPNAGYLPAGQRFSEVDAELHARKHQLGE